MTAQILASELGNLIQDSKRKNAELRNAADKSLQDLKALPNTSETQLAFDLSRRPYFISPFLVACGTHNAKFGSTGVSCLQRLAVSRALPRERLTEVLDGLKECVSLSNDVQLKILQALPSLLQNYPAEIRGDSLSTALQICSSLQNSKNFAVSNTAAATLQQLVILVYDRVVIEDDKALEIPTAAEVHADGETVPVRPAAHDAYKVLNDLNLLITGEKPSYIRFSSIPPTATLELIEAILSNHGKIIAKHVEQAHILRTLLMPLIIRSLSERLSFAITVRVFRVLYLLIRNHLTIMPSEYEIALGLLNHMLDPEASPLWKRALCLEVFRGIYSDSRLVLDIYGQFDEQEGKKNIFGDNLAAFVRLATEKPAVIGLGQQSSVPIGGGDSKDSTSEQAVAEAGALAGVIGGPVLDFNPNGLHIGISAQWSSIKTPCMEHLDKTDAPSLPETYVYSLVLTCITSISESLAKFVLPLTVHHEKGRKRSRTEDHIRPDIEESSPTTPRPLARSQSYRKKNIPMNPLALTDHPAHAYIQTTSTLVTECWPAVLATCSTFLNAALDTEYYRGLVRAIQKFTQVAGLLRLSTPRDAFLTTLGKAAVPAGLLLANVSSSKTSTQEQSGVFSNAKGLLSVDSLVSQASSISHDKSRRLSHDINAPPSLGPRNLLCLRALLNLAIALGPTLQKAWSIVFETLQIADFVMAMSNLQSSGRMTGPTVNRIDSEMSLEKVEAETAAVQAAARRLVESTVDFPNEAFVELLEALCLLLDLNSTTESDQETPVSSVPMRPHVLHQRRMGSVSGVSFAAHTNARDSMFALNKVGELATINETRLALCEPHESGWDVFVAVLVRFSVDDHKSPAARLLAADVLTRIVRDIAQLSMADEQRNAIQSRVLSALQTQIAALHADTESDTYDDTEIKVHQVALDALKGIIEQCGELLVAGWDSVFEILMSVFIEDPLPTEVERTAPTTAQSRDTHSAPHSIEVITKQLARSAFGAIQLICSDFLAVVPDTSLSTLLQLLLDFCCQQEDLNMSLTAITFFWNVSDFLHSRSDVSSITNILNNAADPDTIHSTIQDHSQKGSLPTLWLQVLVNLSAITTDKRAELRNSAVQTMQRIFENYVDQLTPQAWMFCLRVVLFGMVQSNLRIQESLRVEPRATPSEIDAWNQTTRTILDSVAVLISTSMDKVKDPAELGSAWSHLLDDFQGFFSCESHALGLSVFTTISSVLTKMESDRALGQFPLKKTADVWKEYFGHRDSWRHNPEDNQEAFVAYAEAFKSIYRLAQKSLDSILPSMLTNLEMCIVDSDAIPYSSDVDLMTPLQKQVMECLDMLQLDSPELAAFLIQLLSRVIVLPYTSAEAHPGKHSPTFVAIAKASMSQLQSIVIKNAQEENVYTSGAFHFALASLARPIQQKYVWLREGKSPTLWQKATTTALAILEPGLEYIKCHDMQVETSRAVWSETVKIASAIISAQASSVPAQASLESDEAFDIEAFGELRNMITFSLGSTDLPDSLRREYTRQLFETSIVHEEASGNSLNLASGPLEDLYKIRFGQTKNPEPTLRAEMAYASLSELFSLVSVHDGSRERVKLAQAAAPYLILRAALPLRAYIADHPLRGRMPAPESQQRELLFVLGELGKLNSEPQAIPNVPGVTSTHKKHLHRLYPLVVKATRTARNDAEIFERLITLTDMVGHEFGLEED